jgi:hypothetical protein
MQPRHVFCVERWIQFIELCVFKLFANKGFQPSSLLTLLDDITIIIRFGGGKGGKKMAFKWCLFVMNAPKPTSSVTLDLLATMEAFEKYNNVYDAIFKHHIDESNNMIFNNEWDPICVTIINKEGHPLLI